MEQNWKKKFELGGDNRIRMEKSLKLYDVVRELFAPFLVKQEWGLGGFKIKTVKG